MHAIHDNATHSPSRSIALYDQGIKATRSYSKILLDSTIFCFFLDSLDLTFVVRVKVQRRIGFGIGAYTNHESNSKGVGGNNISI